MRGEQIYEFQSNKEIREFIDKYEESGGIVTHVREGTLGYGVILFTSEHRQDYMIVEEFQNHWTSKHILEAIFIEDVAEIVGFSCADCLNESPEPHYITTDGQGLFVQGYCQVCKKDIEDGDGDYFTDEVWYEKRRGQ